MKPADFVRTAWVLADAEMDRRLRGRLTVINKSLAHLSWERVTNRAGVIWRPASNVLAARCRRARRGWAGCRITTRDCLPSIAPQRRHRAMRRPSWRGVRRSSDNSNRRCRLPPASAPSECHDSIGLLDEAGHIGRGDPLPADTYELVLGRPTGDSATLSDVDRSPVLPGLAEKVSGRRQPHAFYSLERIGL